MAKKVKGGPCVAVLEATPPIQMKIRALMESNNKRVFMVSSLKDFFTPFPGTKGSVDIFVPDPALFVIGLRLADGTGLEAVAKLRSSRKWKNVPIIMVAHEAKREIVAKALSLGVNEYILKPFDDHDFLHRSLELLDEHKPEEQELPTVSYNLDDIVAKEVSRSKRTLTPFSLLMIGVPCLLQGECSSLNRCSKLAQGWNTRIVQEIVPKLRDIDTVIPCGMGTVAVSLPLTPQAGAQVVESKLLHTLTSLLDSLRTSKCDDMEFALASITYPDDSDNWQALLEGLKVKLNAAAGVKHPAADSSLPLAA